MFALVALARASMIPTKSEVILEKLALVLDKQNALCQTVPCIPENPRELRTLACSALPENLVASEDVTVEPKLLGSGYTGAVLRGNSKRYGPVAVKFPQVTIQDAKSDINRQEAFTREIALAEEFTQDNLPMFVRCLDNIHTEGEFSFQVEANGKIHNLTCLRSCAVTELITGGIVYGRIFTDSRVEVEGYLIQSVLMILNSVTKHKKMHRNMHCHNLLVREDYKFQYCTSQEASETVQVNSNCICIIDFHHVKDVNMDSAETLLNDVFYGILYNHVYIQLFPELRVIQEVVNDQNSMYNLLLDEVLQAFAEDVHGKEDILTAMAAKAKELRGAFENRHIKNLADFSIIKNLFGKAAALFGVEKPDLTI
jgi:hypothetical protein